MINRRIALVITSLVVLIGSNTVRATYGQDSAAAGTVATITSAKAKRIIAARAREVILAIKRRDTARLSAFVHPDKGVRFTPYNYVSITSDLVFSRDRIRNLLLSKKRHVWGDYEGSGDPIRLTFSEYYKIFIYDQDFASMPGVNYNTFNTRGSADNPWEFYPGAIIVGYYYPGIEGPRGGIMDWKGLRLVFQKKGKTWFLVGILHDEWLI